MSEPILSVRDVWKRFGGSGRRGRRFARGRTRRQARHHRAQRLRQDDADQLRHRRAAPRAGSVIFEGHDISALPAYRRARRGIARSFQIPRPFVGITVVQNIHGAARLCRAHPQRAARDAHELLALVGLEARADHPAESLTHLELRKLELARALAAKPRLLIADEVMAGLRKARSTRYWRRCLRSTSAVSP